MTAVNHLEIKGNLREHPLAELLLEISQTNLSGSFRLSNADRKAIVYVTEGAVVFAVSNQRHHRLFEILIREKRLPAQTIVGIPNFTNDFELAKNLVKNQLMKKAEADYFFVQQIREILQSVFDWDNGEWVFSSLARAKEGIYFHVNLRDILVEYARSRSSVGVSGRFKSLQEAFRVKPNQPQVNFMPREAFVLSRFEDSTFKIEEVQALSGLSVPETYHVLYTLWLGGYLSRQAWNQAFSAGKVAEISSAKLVLKKEEAKTETADRAMVAPKPVAAEVAEPVEPEKAAAPVPEISLEDYLKQIENAKHFYETLGVDSQTATLEIKKAYFAYAKQFHPDLFYRTTDTDTHRRVQQAFTALARAYETLRDEKAREVYDYKLRKELAEAANRRPDEKTDLQGQAKMAEEFFRQGFDLLAKENYEDALPYLGRAVHLVPGNARYHAFFGKAMAADEKQRYKAEAEMQKAVKFEPKNVTYRLILVEFYIDYNLPKRAEGELKRLLAIAPDNREALALLDSLMVK